MLQITPVMLHMLRSAQEAANSKVRRKTQRAKSARRLNTDRANELTDLTSKILRTGQPTNFAFEGACRAGIRASLCLQGWGWTDADEAALAVVGRALNRIGAERPTWDQGQPEYAVLSGLERTRCARCGDKIEEDRSTRGLPRKYCSKLCSYSAYHERARISGQKVSRAEYLALSAARSKKTLEDRATDCANCGVIFLTKFADKKFCSQACYHQSHTKYAERDCENCGKTFKPNGRPRKYCSQACAVHKKSSSAFRCLACSTLYYQNGQHYNKTFCSRACSQQGIAPEHYEFVCTPVLSPQQEDHDGTFPRISMEQSNAPSRHQD